MNALIDTYGRRHNNLRISVTDRCNIRCFYCMPADNVQFMERRELLTYEEIERFVRIAVTLGVNKVRLTGGEPLVRKDLHKLVARIAAIPQIKDVGVTTNGILLAEQAQQLWDAGLRRINVSLDALDPVRFKEITRRDGYEKVLEGIQAAQRAGFDPVKINAVSVRGMTEDQIVPFGHFARETGVELRFIEFMPLDADNAWERDKVLFAHEIIETLTREIMPLRRVEYPEPRVHSPNRPGTSDILALNSQLSPLDRHSAPATDYEFADGVGRVGFIASISRPFCMSCNRFRLTADGKLRNCLFSLEETDVKGLIRDPSATDDDIATTIRQCIESKKEGHEINTSRFIQPERPMYSIGG